MLPNPNLPAVGPMWLNRDSRVTCLLECFYSHPRWHERLFQYHYASQSVWSYNQFWNTGQTSCLSHYSHSRAPLGSLTVPQREWSLTLLQHLAGGAVAEAPFTSSLIHTFTSSWMVCCIQRYKLTSRKRPL